MRPFHSIFDRRLLTIFVLCLSSAWLAADGISFRESIAPILLSRCYACHDAEKAEGGYRIDTFAALLRAGDTDLPPVVAGHPDDSELWRRLVTDDVDERMPFEGDRLSEPSLKLIRQWMVEGARFDGPDREAALPTLPPVISHPEPPEFYRAKIPVTSLTFSLDARQLLVGGYHEILCWDLVEHRLSARIPQVGQRIHGLEIGEGRLYVASGAPGQLGEVRVFDQVTHALLGVPLVTTDVVLDLQRDPAGTTLAAAGADGKIHLIDLAELKVTRSIASHSDWVHGIAWNEDGTQLASASRDKTAKVFDAATGRPITTYGEHGDSVTGVCFAPGGQTIVSCDAQGELHVWRAGDGQKRKSNKVGGKEAFRLVGAPTGVWLGSDDSHLRQFDWRGERLLWDLRGRGDGVLSIALDDARRRIATGGFDGTIRVWNLQSGLLEHEFVPFPGQTDRVD